MNFFDAVVTTLSTGVNTTTPTLVCADNVGTWTSGLGNFDIVVWDDRIYSNWATAYRAGAGAMYHVDTVSGTSLTIASTGGNRNALIGSSLAHLAGCRVCAVLSATELAALQAHTHTVTYRSVIGVAEQYTNTSTSTIWLVPGFSSNLGAGHSASSALSFPTPPGTIKNLRVMCSANTWTGGINITVYQGTNISTITCTLAQGSLVSNDLVHTLTITEGQGIEFAVAPSGSGSYSNLSISVELERTVTTSTP